jgi:protein O-GlcNAc transferase
MSQTSLAHPTTIQPERLQVLLEQINGGQAAEALMELDRLHTEQPANPSIAQLQAEALRLVGRSGDAVHAYRRAGELGAGARCWLAAGILLAAERATDESVQCLLKAYAQAPDDENVLDALITTLFNGSRHKDGIEYARRQIAISTNPTLMSRAALVLQANDLYEESTSAFKRIVQLAPDDPTIIGAALVPSRFTCEWEWIDSLQQRISACYALGDFTAPQEFPLTHLTWCADEARNLGVTRAYVARMVARQQPLSLTPPPATGRRLRVGYLSSDFRNHATMHLMAGMLEHHDRDRFEIFAYDYTTPDISQYRQRFLNAVEHHVPILDMSDAQAAARIAADQLDILFDLKLYTGGGRAGILAYRPAPLIAAWLGFPGSAASADVDYIVSDRFVTPDSSGPHYTEKFCRLPHSYQCNDRKRAAAPEAGTRAAHGLPEDRIVFGAFNQSYKIDRGSFVVWMRILEAVPGSVLWMLGQSESARANLARYAQQAGIGPERIIFAPFADPREHLARLPLADALLDALVCNGHTTTSDALWAGAPVITARGRHFASRVSESLLNAIGLPELVGTDADDMVRIATRIGTDGGYRADLRARVAANRLSTPLFDTARFTRDFELAIEMMAQRRQNGLALEHIDVPDQGPVELRSATTAFVGRVSGLQTAYLACPLCAGAGTTVGFANCTANPQWHEPLPPSTEWAQCSACGHIHSRNHWTATGITEVFRGGKTAPAAEFTGGPEERAISWTPVVDRAVKLLGGYPSLLSRASRPIWVDVGCGAGALVMAASDHGFAAIGVDFRGDLVSRIQALGFNALCQDFTTLDFQITPNVLSMMESLEQMPHPREALLKAATVLQPGGVLVIGTCDVSSSAWRAMEAAKTNPCWADLERHHVFSRDRLFGLLRDSGFDIADFTLSACGKAQMEIYARRR